MSDEKNPKQELLPPAKDNVPADDAAFPIPQGRTGGGLFTRWFVNGQTKLKQSENALQAEETKLVKEMNATLKAGIALVRTQGEAHDIKNILDDDQRQRDHHRAVSDVDRAVELAQKDQALAQARTDATHAPEAYRAKQLSEVDHARQEAQRLYFDDRRGAELAEAEHQAALAEQKRKIARTKDDALEQARINAEIKALAEGNIQRVRDLHAADRVMGRAGAPPQPAPDPRIDTLERELAKAEQEHTNAINNGEESAVIAFWGKRIVKLKDDMEKANAAKNVP